MITGAGAYFSIKLLLVESFGILIHATRTNVQGDANSCPFTANTFRPERDSAKKQTKLICVVCILPVCRAISVGKKPEGN